MAKWSIIALALIGCAIAEPPVGYSYSAPQSYILVSSGGGHGGGGYSSGGYSSGGYSSGGYSSGGHGGYSGGGSALSSGGHYTSVPVGHQTSEGYHIDPHLLEKIRHIILKDEIQNQAYSSASSSGHGHGVSSHYGPPAPVYGVPQDRIVGVELEHLQQGIQVAQYHQAEEGHGGYASGFSGYSSGGHGGFSSGGHGGFSSGGHGGFSSGGGHGLSSGHASISYSAPSSGSYHTIGVPSGSYGVPSPSSSYGSPHH